MKFEARAFNSPRLSNYIYAYKILTVITYHQNTFNNTLLEARNHKVATNISCGLMLSLMNVSVFCRRGLIICNSSLKISGVIRKNPWKLSASAGINSLIMKCLSPRSVGRFASHCRHHMLHLERCSRLRLRRFKIMKTAVAAAKILILSDIFCFIQPTTSSLYVITSRVILATPYVRRTVRR